MHFADIIVPELRLGKKCIAAQTRDLSSGRHKPLTMELVPFENKHVSDKKRISEYRKENDAR